MAHFILLLHDNPASFADASAEEIQKVIGEYSAWRQQLEKRELLLDGRKLADEGGRVLTADNGKVRVVDGPYAEAKEVVGGFFMIQAKDYSEAVAIARDCPHLRYGGRIELREIDDLAH